MNFEKLSAEVAALLKGDAETGTQMTAEQFAAYAGEQVAKAQAEAAAGNTVVAKSRIEALAGEVEKITKYNFAAGSLPVVAVFKDPAQTTHAEVSAPSGETAPSGEHWVAKSAEFSAFLASALTALKPEPAPATIIPGTDTAPEVESWPADLAKAVVTDELRDFKV